ncbi:tape measure protein [Arthrobacter sp. FW306-2-2C-D06B]|uniref:tape measure protein n=1 Tax=Arthrobacter sp. FW306-2-2C-D06B TaxID=2879618 RepID=UPI001F2D93F6|nr:tape measure protein [Arthrobacter sp. FW306-2-2C-D06B]UKA59155.1 tape measure protein [Arthrobacter sp. FW306-2-2C-D06B]
MPTIGVADILVVPVFKDLQKKVGKELDAAASSAGDSAGKSLGSKLTGAVGGFMSGTMKAAGIAGGLTVGAAFGTALAKGFGRLQAIEEAKAKLSGLGHSAETVQGIMNDAMAAVKGTAFGLGDAATVAAGAVAAGVKPGKDLERTLKLTGDAATIAGVGMGEMGAIFNKVSASNKIQGDVIAQLNDAGIPIIQLLGKELGKSAEETVKLASEGKINFETFQNAMEKGLGGAALKSGETLRGAFKNTIASVGRIGASLLSGVYPKIQQFFAGAINWLKPLEEGAKIAGSAIGTFLDKALSGAQAIWDLVVGGNFTSKFREIFHVEEDSQLVDFLLKVRDGAKGLYDLIVGGDYTG